MIVVIPVYEGDRELVVKNLEWVISLEGKVPFKVVISHESGFDASAIVELAQQYFSDGVDEYSYYPWKGDPRWPIPQNWAWQQSAKKMRKLEHPWLWWEADATPLREGWLAALKKEYEELKKPFMGFWVTTNGRPYMAGVGVYPFNVAHYSTSAFSVQHVSFDVELGQFIQRLVAETGLIVHQVNAVSFETKEMIEALPKDAVLFHKCKDGTLLDKLHSNWVESHHDLAEKAKITVGKIQESVRDFILGPATKLGVIAYVPPPHVGFPQVFLDNLYDFLPASPLYILSEHPWKDAIKIPDPIRQAGKTKNRIANFIFREVLQFARKQKLTHFIYLESDCRVKGTSWDQRLFDEFFANKKAIVGGALAVAGPSASGLQFENLFREKVEQHNGLNKDGSRHTWPIMEQGKVPGCEAVVFVNGAPAVYSVEPILSLLDGNVDRITSSNYPYDFEIGRLITKEFGPIETITNRITFTPGTYATEGEKLIPIGVRMADLTDQKICAVHPIKTRWRAVKDEPRFYHSGDYGDLIYALASIRMFGRGQLWIGPETKTKYPPRCAFNQDAFNSLRPLLECQPYLSLIDFAPKYPEVHFDLNIFRDYWSSITLRNSSGIHTLAKMHAFSLGLHEIFNYEPWLTIPEPNSLSEVVIHRSARYNETDFPWQQIVSKFKGKAAFVGIFDEHKDFCRLFGNVPFYPTSNLLELAQIIRGAKWFIGNQSLPCALAIGMGQNVYQETWSTSPDCVFERDNFFNQSTPIENVPWML